MTAKPSARPVALVAACAALFAVVLIWFQATSGPSAEGSKTIEYEGVEIDIPSTWERLDMSDCEFQSERWAQPDSPPCDFEGGAAFYGSTTFDPAHGPG
ncbi:MAG: hypothetical protein M3406_12995, partial [Chloroflexota bacterium]|nr:hypothetical protein [Chloroflexota bacterium]